MANQESGEQKSGEQNSRKQNSRKHDTRKHLARESAHPAVLATLVVMFLLGALVVPTVSNQLGMFAYDLETGRGRATVSSCHDGWPWQDCTATLTAWSGEAHQVGDRVVVRSTSALSGEVEVVGRVRGVSTIDEYKQSNFSTEDVVMSADVWVMPEWVRIPVLLGLGTIWLALMWAASQVVRRLTARKGSSADGGGR